MEVKATSNPSPRDWKNLAAFLDKYSDIAVGGLLLHDGTEATMLTERITAAPWWAVV